MAKVKLQKGSEEFEMFQDYWNMIQEYWGVEENEAYWERAVAGSKEFYEKYHTPFSKGLVKAYLEELERRAKHAKM